CLWFLFSAIFLFIDDLGLVNSPRDAWKRPERLDAFYRLSLKSVACFKTGSKLRSVALPCGQIWNNVTGQPSLTRSTFSSATSTVAHVFFLLFSSTTMIFLWANDIVVVRIPKILTHDREDINEEMMEIEASMASVWQRRSGIFLFSWLFVLFNFDCFSRGHQYHFVLETLYEL
uniref:Uncharacterized protein n=1 Tax=Strigamia maritima TaxID=126957 RepID=T1IPC1_STRMM